METFNISKNMPNAALVSKCVTAARSGNYTGLTRKDIETTLDSIAKALAAEEGCEFAEAYEAVTSGNDGKLLYEAYAACPAEGEAPPIEKHEISKAEKLEQEVQHFSETYGVPVEKARAMVREYYQNSK